MSHLHSTGPPSRGEIEDQFVDLLAGRSTRDQVDHWAAQWVAAADPDVDDDLVWWGLVLLYGIDMRHGPAEPYLHDIEQIGQWLEEFRSRARDGY